MGFQAVFRRYELKFLLNSTQKEAVLTAMALHMQPDAYGKTTISNVYYDTPDNLLIRRSIEKPVYKEKLRLRSYQRAGEDSPVFVELKKKYQDVVFKRRLQLPNRQAVAWLAGGRFPGTPNQICREIEYFRDFYRELSPAVFLSYERQAWYGLDDPEFRVTMDDTILCRREALSLGQATWGIPLLPEGMTLMEIKCAGGIPLWMTRELSRQKIYKTSFSKYGMGYGKLIFPQSHPVNQYAVLEVKHYV